MWSESTLSRINILNLILFTKSSDDGTYSVWLGPDYEEGKWYEAESVHPHPEFSSGDKSKMHLDIGLIKLKSEVKFEHKGKYYSNNLICLPVINFMHEPTHQIGLLSGWGKKSPGIGMTTNHLRSEP